MAESIDKLPLGIYKSIMNKTYEQLNRPRLYLDDRISLLPSMFKATERYSPCRNTDYDLEEIKKRNTTRKLSKSKKLNSRESFFIDYLLSLNN